ncbi:MAG: hypothetical protein ACYC9S_12905 [Leptospirales bacterium]
MNMKKLKKRALYVGTLLLGAWALLFFMHVIFDAIWLFFWIGLAAIVLSLVLHVLERVV